MRIGISTTMIQRGHSGVAQHLFGLVRALLPHCDENELTLFVLEDDLPLFEFAKGRMHLVLVPEQFRGPAENILWHQTTAPRLVRRHGLDVMHVPSYRRLLWPKPCATVATIHDLAPFHVEKKYDWLRMFYGRAIVPHLARRQDEIIAVSETTARDVERFLKVPRERLTVVYNGVDRARFHPNGREQSRAQVAQRHGIARPFLLYVARLEHPAKNHVRLIEAFDSFKTDTKSDWQLVFAGKDWHGAEAIHAAVGQSRFGKDIRCLGFVPDADLPDLYRAAAIFVYPSCFEGFGMPPTEAMACGCPVICSAEGALGEVAGDAAVIINPQDVPAMARELRNLASDPAARERLQLAGLARVSRFDWSIAAKATLAVYARATARRSAKHQLPVIFTRAPVAKLPTKTTSWPSGE